ncbi:MAG: phosphoribosyltransferase [Bacteroidia bacterium]
MRYKDRPDAAFQLIPYLDKYKNDKGVVLAVPRGGVPIAYYVAKHYNFPLELLMIKKIGHPSNPEFAIGAVSLEDYIIDERQDISKSYIDEQVKAIRTNLKERYKLFMGDHKPIELKNKTIIIVDDGIATGNTVLSSIKMLRKQSPEKIVVAVPVAPRQTAIKMKKEVDDFICPYLPEDFFGVGYHYLDFSEVSDKEVIRLLKEIDEFKKAA